MITKNQWPGVPNVSNENSDWAENEIKWSAQCPMKITDEHDRVPIGQRKNHWQANDLDKRNKK
jgi:hypothetical protein